MIETYVIRKFVKDQVYVNAFMGQSRMEVVDVKNNEVVLKNTWFDACVMDWVTDVVSIDVERSRNPREDTYFNVTHEMVLVESEEEERKLLEQTNKMIDNYKMKVMTKVIR